MKTEMMTKQSSKPFKFTGKSAIEMIIEILIGLTKAITTAFSNVVDRFNAFFRREKPALPSTAKTKEKAELAPSYFSEKSNKKTLKLDAWSRFMAELEDGMEIVWAKTVESKDFVFEALRENEIISILWTMLTCEDYIVFWAGVILPMIFPTLSPFLGVMFWTVIGYLQLLCGLRNSQLQRHLGWTEIEGDEGMSEPETVEFAGVPEETLAVSDEPERNTEETVEAVTPTKDAIDLPLTTPFLHAAAPTRSAPTVNAEKQEQQQPRLDAIWRNCNSETECKQKENKPDEGAQRRSTRRGKLVLQRPLQLFGVHDIRRVAPPIDSTQAVRHAIEEVERRRKAKLAAAKLLDEDEFDKFNFDAEDNWRADNPIAELIDEPSLIEGPTQLKSDRKDKSLKCEDVGDGETRAAETTLVEDVDSYPKDGERKKRELDVDEEQRERIKFRIRGVEAELHELKALADGQDLD